MYDGKEAPRKSQKAPRRAPEESLVAAPQQSTEQSLGWCQPRPLEESGHYRELETFAFVEEEDEPFTPVRTAEPATLQTASEEDTPDVQEPERPTVSEPEVPVPETVLQEVVALDEGANAKPSAAEYVPQGELYAHCRCDPSPRSAARSRPRCPLHPLPISSVSALSR